MARRLAAATVAYSSSAEEAVALESLVKQVLIGTVTGVSYYQIPVFLSAGRELYKLTKKFASQSLAMEASVIIAKWVARGLTEAVLFAVRDALNIPAPIEP
jgi:hypothetical protein